MVSAQIYHLRIPSSTPRHFICTQSVLCSYHIVVFSLSVVYLVYHSVSVSLLTHELLGVEAVSSLYSHSLGCDGHKIDFHYLMKGSLFFYCYNCCILLLLFFKFYFLLVSSIWKALFLFVSIFLNPNLFLLMLFERCA